MELEYFNHIFAVMSIFGFLYGRKNFLSDLIEADVLSNGSFAEKVEKIIIDIENVISRFGKDSEIIKGISASSVDISNDTNIELLKVREHVAELMVTHVCIVDEEQKIRTTSCNGINIRFKNISFLLALLSFEYLILAAIFPHTNSLYLGNFMAMLNLTICISILVTSIINKVRHNGTYIILFIISNLIGFITLFFIYKKWYLFSYFSFDCIMFYTLITLLIPWLICFLLHALEFKKCSTNINNKSVTPAVEKLNEYSSFLKTKENLNKDKSRSAK